MKSKSEVEVKKLRVANQFLKQWLFDHIDNPYPTVDEKQELMKVTSLTRKRIDAWFKNARHRYMCSFRKAANPNYSRYPSQVTNILIDWLVEYSTESHRYPTKQEEERLLKQTKLTKVQLRRWCSNAWKRGLLARIKRKQVANVRLIYQSTQSVPLANDSAPTGAYIGNGQAQNAPKASVKAPFKLPVQTMPQQPNGFVSMVMPIAPIPSTSSMYPLAYAKSSQIPLTSPSIYQANVVHPMFAMGLCANAY